MNRRTFNKSAGLSALGLAAGASPLPAAEAAKKDGLSVHLFSKHLQFLDYPEMARVAADLGFNGLDLTVRPGGHVAPERVEDELPRAVEALHAAGLRPFMMASGVNNADDPVNRRVLKTAAAHGIRAYRTAYYDFQNGLSWQQDLERMREKFRALGRFNADLGLHGAYQNHAGPRYPGAYIPDVAYLLEGADPRRLGCQYDIRHATVEGGTAWPRGLGWIKDHIPTIVIKDFRWEQIDGRHRPVNVPFGTGMVDFDRYFSLLRGYGLKPVATLHLEFPLGGAEHGRREIELPRDRVYAAMRRDLENLHAAWEKSA